MSLVDDIAKITGSIRLADVNVDIKKVRVGGTDSTTIVNNFLILGNDVLQDPDKLAAFQKRMIEAFSPQKKEAYFATPESQEKLPDIRDINTREEEIEFFQGKISDTDYTILRVALYSKKQHDNGNHNEGDRAKQEAINRYGERARSIINIYSANYFATTLKPLYEILEESGDERFKEKFDEMFRIIIEEEIFTLFVANSQTTDQLLTRIREKIDVNRSYGAYKINIHGINEGNVEKIRTLIQRIHDEIEGEPQIISNNKAIMVRIMLKRSTSNNSQQGNDLVEIV